MYSYTSLFNVYIYKYMSVYVNIRVSVYVRTCGNMIYHSSAFDVH